MKTLYETTDVRQDALVGQTIAVLGYGSQGRAQALNLRDSGLDTVVGLRRGGPSWDQALADGWSPLTTAEAVRRADVVAMLVPDLAQPKLFASVAEHLREGSLLLFAHGFNVHFDRISPPAGVDVGLVAPKAPGALVRREFEEGKGVPCLLAIHTDATGTAHDRTLAFAHGIGGTRAGVLATTFAEETETDLFGEQAVLCGGVTELIVVGWEVLVEAGYNPEVAYFECLHELKLIVDLLHEGGMAKMHQYVSETASFGDLTRGNRIIDEGTRDRMRAVLAEVRTGRFAREWIEEDEAGRPNYERLLKRDLEHPIEAVGAGLRARMPWLQGAI
jgi:ketol-acid reductoisomerase